MPQMSTDCLRLQIVRDHARLNKYMDGMKWLAGVRPLQVQLLPSH